MDKLAKFAPMKIRLLCLVILAGIISSCTRNEEQNRVFNLADLYIAGDSTGDNKIVPVYWNNNIKTELPISNSANSGFARCIKVIGPDVYIAGAEIDSNGFGFPVVWKNGIRTVLPTVDPRAEANGMYISGADVYVVGYEQNAANTERYPVLWKNGIRTRLTPAGVGGSAFSVVVSDQHVYIAGGWVENNQFHPVLWTNGSRSLLSTTVQGVAYSVSLTGNDVYVSGAEIVNNSWYPVYWKNGVKVILPFDPSMNSAIASDIKVLNNDIYVTGTESLSNSPHTRAILWKNGVRSQLATLYNSIAYATSLFITGSDIFVTGCDSGRPAYWKNGELFILGEGDCSGVSVTGRQ